MPIIFACFSPHPPLLLPNVGSEEDRKKVKNTIDRLEQLAKSFKKTGPDSIIISSPHPDWGFEVPLYFLAKDFQGRIEKNLIGLEPPKFYFEKGKEFYKLKIENCKLKIALIASGDLSHCLKEDGPYGLHPDGLKFDQEFIKALKHKNIKTILKLDELYSNAGECGLRSFSFLLGILEEAKINWRAEILSYESPFGVGYLVANFTLK